jgi:hypothetical protein
MILSQYNATYTLISYFCNILFLLFSRPHLVFQVAHSRQVLYAFFSYTFRPFCPPLFGYPNKKSKNYVPSYCTFFSAIGVHLCNRLPLLPLAHMLFSIPHAYPYVTQYREWRVLSVVKRYITVRFPLPPSSVSCVHFGNCRSVSRIIPIGGRQTNIVSQHGVCMQEWYSCEVNCLL